MTKEYFLTTGYNEFRVIDMIKAFCLFFGLAFFLSFAVSKSYVITILFGLIGALISSAFVVYKTKEFIVHNNKFMSISLLYKIIGWDTKYNWELPLEQIKHVEIHHHNDDEFFLSHTFKKIKVYPLKGENVKFSVSKESDFRSLKRFIALLAQYEISYTIFTNWKPLREMLDLNKINYQAL
ncbi:MAG: hypothetical protein GY810_31480 [Aureispira sp.]|nr:hypothetical protein [Aureispira sp.]